MSDIDGKTKTERAIVILAEAGHNGLSADMFGALLWANEKRGQTSSNGGGGDYAAQMMLGRLRKQGLVRTKHTEGSSVWEVTPFGMAHADIIRNEADRIASAKKRASKS